MSDSEVLIEHDGFVRATPADEIRAGGGEARIVDRGRPTRRAALQSGWRSGRGTLRVITAVLLAGAGLLLAGCETPVRLHPSRASWAATNPVSLDQARLAWIRGDREKYNETVNALLRISGSDVSVAGAPARWLTRSYQPAYFDRVEPVLGARITGLATPARFEGWGVPLVAFRVNRHRLAIERFYPPEGISRALTALLVFPKSGRPVLEIFDPADGLSVLVDGRFLPLNVDESAPYARLWDIAGASLTRSSINGLLSSQGLGRDPGMFLLEPYRPEKTPVIMIHGLLSSPLVWKEMTNLVWADPELRRRYQVWHYFYPTSFPYLHTAALFRDRLADLRRALDVSASPRAPVNRAVILAHSMGGLVAHALVSSSGDALWKAGFRVPPDQLDVSPATRARLRSYFFFQPVPGIRRVVFIAVPHRGSIEADAWIGLLGRSLVRLPKDYLDVFREVQSRNPGVLRGILAEMGRGRVSSIRVLSTRNDVRDALAARPIRAGVVFHSIIGNRSARRKEDADDGFVTYRSAHLDGAASELVIHSAHDEPHRAEAVQEVRRILLEQIAESRPEGRR